MKLIDIVEGIDRSAKEKADNWIDGWTYDSASEKDNITDAEIAFSVYPYKRRITLYRGLNFQTKADYDSFKQKTQDFKILDEKFLTSWSLDEDQAAAFAMIDDEYDDQGYAGVVIGLKTDSKLKVINAQKSRYGENELIVFPEKLTIFLKDSKIFETEKK